MELQKLKWQKCVKKSEHSFEYQKCPTGGTLVPTDNDNFDVWTLLGSSIKKCIQKNSDVFGSKLTSLRHIKTDPVNISIRGGRFQKLKPCYRACPIPAHWYTKGRSILADLEEQGLIVRVTEASEYRSPCFFIAKPYDPSQGLFCSGDEFGQRLEIILSNYPKFRNFIRVVDDIAVCGELLGELLEQFSLFLDICREHHLTQKFQMCYPEHSIRFAGMIMSSKGLSPASDKMSVIRDFPIPNNRTDLRSWLGLCQRFSMWYPELASCQSGLRHLVRDDVPCQCSSKMTGQMEATKHLLCGDVHVHSYDIKLVPTIFVDGSILHGARYILVQQEGRFFSADDYKSCLDVIETPLDGRSVDPQNNTNVKLLGKGGGDCSPPIEGGETSPTYDSICDDGGFGTETTDCFVSKGHASTHYSVRPCETELKRENQISSPINWVGVDPFYFGGSHFLFMIDGFSQTESSIIMECASVYNPQSNSTAEQNLVILKNCLKIQLVEERIFYSDFTSCKIYLEQQKVCHQLDYFFQRGMIYSPPDIKDELSAGLQRHHDRERQREVQHLRRERGLGSPLEQGLFLQNGTIRGKPFSKMRTLGGEEDEEENDEEENDEFPANEEEMVDEDVTDVLGNDEVHNALSAGMVISSGTFLPVPQICTLSTGTQLPSALRAVQTASRPGQLGARPGQLGARGEKTQAVHFTLPCYLPPAYGQVTSAVQDLLRLGQTLVTTTAVKKKGKFISQTVRWRIL